MKTNLKNIWTLSISIGLCAWSASDGWAAPPYVNYQGLLNGADGQPLPTGNYTMQFSIYDQAQSGSRVWGPFIFDGAVLTGHGPQVPVANGRFNVIIGPQDTNGVPISTAFGSSNRFMEITVAGGPAIQPRQQFLSTAYAFAVGNANFELSAGGLMARGTNALLLGVGAAPAPASISYRSNSPSLLIQGAGTNDSSRNITLSGAVSVTNAPAGSPALTVAGNASLAGNLTCNGNATITGTLQATSLTDGTRTMALTNVIRSDPPMVIWATNFSDTVNWVIANVDLSVLGNDEDGCKVRVYMQHEVDHRLRPITMDIWFEQPGFANDASFPSTNVKMSVQMFSAADGAYYYGAYDLDNTSSLLFELVSGPWLQVYGGDPVNKYKLQFRVHPNIGAKIMVFDN